MRFSLIRPQGAVSSLMVHYVKTGVYATGKHVVLLIVRKRWQHASLCSLLFLIFTRKAFKNELSLNKKHLAHLCRVHWFQAFAILLGTGLHNLSLHFAMISFTTKVLTRCLEVLEQVWLGRLELPQPRLQVLVRRLQLLAPGGGLTKLKWNVQVCIHHVSSDTLSSDTKFMWMKSHQVLRTSKEQMLCLSHSR